MPLPPPSEKQARVLWFAVTSLAIGVLGALAVGLVWGLGRILHLLSPVLWPLAVAGVLAYLLDPVVDRLERHRVPRTRAIVLVFGFAVVLVAVFAASVVPQVVLETRQLALKVPTYATRVQTKVETWMNNPPAIARRFLPHAGEAGPGAAAPMATNAVPAPTNQISALASTNGPPATNDPLAPPPGAEVEAAAFWSQALDPALLQSATGWLARVLPRAGSWLFGQVTRVAAWFGVLVGLALVPVYLFYFLLEKRAIQSRWTDYLPLARSGFRDELVFVLTAINDYLIAFFRGQVLVALCDGVLYTIGFTLVGVPYSLLIGMVATVLTMIPFLGAIVTCATALVIALVQYGDWTHPLLVLVVFAVVQVIEGVVVSPRIMGNRVGLHPLTIIVAVMVGTTLLGGLLGGILAIPLTAALRVLMFRYVWKHRGQSSLLTLP
jgi:predicted PurR-regulated permease PerM